MVIKKQNNKVVVVGILFSVVSFLFTFNYETEKEKLHFDTRANNIFNKIEYIFTTLRQENSELSSTFYFPDETTKSQFKLFTSSTIKHNNFIESISFSKNIEKKSQAEYELNFQNKGYTGFSIKPFNKDTTDTFLKASFLLPTIYIEPYNVKNSRMFGRDLFSHPAVFDLFNSTQLSKTLTYKPSATDANIIYAIKILYKGQNKNINNFQLSEIYGVLLYKIKLNLPEKNLHYLTISINNKTIFNKKTNYVERSFDIVSTTSSNMDLESQEITIKMQLRKSLLLVDFTYPVIVFLFGLLLTSLTWKIINSHERINSLLRKQKETIENKVKIKTNELQIKADELEAFSYSVSHDLKAPLHSIDGFSQLLQDSYKDTLDADANDYIEHICTASRKMEKIINDLLKLSNISSSNMKTSNCNISEIAERAIDTLQDYTPNHKISLNIKKDIYAEVDSDFLQICFDNLFGNAWKYSSKVDKPQIEFGTTVKGSETVYYVKDNGVGFNMYDSDKLFVPFQRLHHNSQFEGTGIGLMIVQRIIQKHKGQIWAESELGKGAVFYFTLGANTVLT